MKVSELLVMLSKYSPEAEIKWGVDSANPECAGDILRAELTYIDDEFSTDLVHILLSSPDLE